MRPILAPPPAAPVEPGPVPTFSVIIAAYQAADTVGEAVASALDQTVPPHEVIVCDDGSTDDIEGALAPYRERIVVLRQAHSGPGMARNGAVRAASGEFVVILDADDVYLPEQIEALGELAAARPDLDLLATDLYIEQDGRVVGRFNGENPFPIDDQRMEILRRNFLMPPAVRRRRWIEVGGLDNSLTPAEDWDCWLRLILEGARAGLVEEPLMRHRLSADSLTASRAAYQRARVNVLEKTWMRKDLDSRDRTVVEAGLRQQRRDALLTGAEAALRLRHPDARRRALAVGVGAGFGLTTRLKASVAVLAPRTAGQLLDRRDKRTGSSRLRRASRAPASEGSQGRESE